MATNRADTLDPALLRPGRLDRKIMFPSLRDRRQRRLIFSTIASKMSLAPEVDLDAFIMRPDTLSGAMIQAIMQSAGLLAVRKSRYVILQSDIEEAYQQEVKGSSDEVCILYISNCSGQCSIDNYYHPTPAIFSLSPKLATLRPTIASPRFSLTCARMCASL